MSDIRLASLSENDRDELRSAGADHRAQHPQALGRDGPAADPGDGPSHWKALRGKEEGEVAPCQPLHKDVCQLAFAHRDVLRSLSLAAGQSLHHGGSPVEQGQHIDGAGRQGLVYGFGAFEPV